MSKHWIWPVSLVVGLLTALACLAVFPFGVVFHGHDPKHFHWGRIAVGAVISFIVGWGLMRLAARVPPEPRKEEGFDC